MYSIPSSMSPESENLLKKFLIVNCSKRGPSEHSVRGPWMNVSHEGEELKCYVQPFSYWEDPLQTKFMVSMGYRQEDIQDLLRSMRKPWSPACSWVLLSSQEVQLRVSASAEQQWFQQPAFPIFHSLRRLKGATQSLNRIRRQGRRAATQQCTSQLPTSLEGTNPAPAVNSDLPTNTKKSRNSSLGAKAGLARPPPRTTTATPQRWGLRPPGLLLLTSTPSPRPPARESQSVSLQPNQASVPHPTASSWGVPTRPSPPRVSLRPPFYPRHQWSGQSPRWDQVRAAGQPNRCQPQKWCPTG
ncbi:serine/threonine-protein kinase MARK2-like [Pongo pygmaeus]|uniref:serine/threonine-protein kinase MARK2-like n=1 Tax=Pongo pygmaeus TaxID=9600 RepID=UPI0023E19915|nr:serine/threonine-protein kinase MARK2-like [Pongo pygmaeus]